jgi:hypothetical protein
MAGTGCDGGKARKKPDHTCSRRPSHGVGRIGWSTWIERESLSWRFGDAVLEQWGGELVTFSCSGGVSADLFQKINAGAAPDTGVEAQIADRLHQDADHPVA